MIGMGEADNNEPKASQASSSAQRASLILPIAEEEAMLNARTGADVVAFYSRFGRDSNVKFFTCNRLASRLFQLTVLKLCKSALMCFFHDMQGERRPSLQAL